MTSPVIRSRLRIDDWSSCSSLMHSSPCGIRGKTHLGLLSDLPNLGPGLPQRVKEPPQRGPGTQPGVVGIELAIVRRTVQGEQFPS